MARGFLGILFPIAAALLLASVAWPVACLLLAIPPTQAARVFFQEAGPALRVSLEASLYATLAATVLGVPAGYWLAARRPLSCTGRVSAGPSAGVPAGSLRLDASLRFWPKFAGRRLAIGPRNAGPRHAAGRRDGRFFVSGSLVALAATAAFAALDRLYEDAARTLGAGEWRIFARVALPAAAGNVTAGIAFAWLRAIGEYGATSVLAYHPTSLPVAVYVTLSASGVLPALALCYGFVILAAMVLGMQWVLRRSVVPSR